MTPRLTFPIALASRRRACQCVLLVCALGVPALSVAAEQDAAAQTTSIAQTGTSQAGTSQTGTSQTGTGTTGAQAGDDAGGGGGFDFSSSSKPIDITADNGIEWNKNEKFYIARGNALAVQGNQSVAGAVLTAYYSTDSNHIDRMTADGDVVIKNGTQTAYGDHADYDANKKLLVLTGKKLKAVNNDNGDVTTARDSMEYWKDRDALVARGDVYSIHGDTKVRSDLQTGYFHPNSAGKKVIYQIEAIGHVNAVTAKQTATSDKMVYNLESKVAVLTGNVRIVQGTDTFIGDRAEIDTVNNVSRMTADKTKGSRVRTIIGPKNNNDSGPGNAGSTTKP